MNTNNDRQAPMSRAQINEARKRKWMEPPAASKHEMQTRKKERDARAILAEVVGGMPDEPEQAEDVNHSADSSSIAMSPASTLSYGYGSPVASSLAFTIPESLASSISVSPVQPVNLFPCPIAQPQPPAAAASWWTGWCAIS